MNPDTEQINDKALELVEIKLKNILKTGFGEIRIIIRNGIVYRILSTEDELVEKRNNK